MRGFCRCAYVCASCAAVLMDVLEHRHRFGSCWISRWRPTPKSGCAQTLSRFFVHACMCMCMYVCACVCVLARTYACMCMCVCVCMHPWYECVYACTNARTHACLCLPACRLPAPRQGCTHTPRLTMAHPPYTNTTHTQVCAFVADVSLEPATIRFMRLCRLDHTEEADATRGCSHASAPPRVQVSMYIMCVCVVVCGCACGDGSWLMD